LTYLLREMRSPLYTKKFVNRSVSFVENELVPLNGRIQFTLFMCKFMYNRRDDLMYIFISP